LKGSAQVGAYNSRVPEDSLIAQEAESEAILTRLSANVVDWDNEREDSSAGNAYPIRRRRAEGCT
jgi:hypothetical protein